jgi:hypothetical protein
MTNVEIIASLIELASKKALLKKAVFSKPSDKETVKTVATLRQIGGEAVLQLERFTKDNKALHVNLKISDSDFSVKLSELALGYMQINVITSEGDAEYRCSKSGNSTVIGEDKLRRAMERTETKGEAIANNKQKDYILKGDEPFLRLLEISDKNGRIHDKKQAKFRQINRFLEHIRDVLKYIPEGDIRICDLCCGKSYLSFAVYHYFAVIKGREVKMTGVDLKADVIEYCSGVAKSLGFDGLEFICGDVNLYNTEDKVNMVVSLHACDIATDIVIGKAIEWQAEVILSTPCCHHEMNRLLNCESLSFISDYSMLRQKLCDAATDALRLKLMEANGYETAALELIDPEETPKNIMLRGIRKKDFDKNGEKAKQAIEEYRRVYTFLTGLEQNRWEVF